MFYQLNMYVDTNMYDCTHRSFPHFSKTLSFHVPNPYKWNEAKTVQEIEMTTIRSESTLAFPGISLGASEARTKTSTTEHHNSIIPAWNNWHGRPR